MESTMDLAEHPARGAKPPEPDPFSRRGLWQIVPFGLTVMFAIQFAQLAPDKEKHWSCAAVLAGCTVFAMTFFAQHIETLKKYGHITAPMSILFIATCMLLSDNPQAKVLPLIPLLVAAAGVITLAIPRYAILFNQPTRLDAASLASLQPTSSGVSAWLIGICGSRDCHSPPATPPGGSEDGISLSPITGQVQCDWDPCVRNFFEKPSSSLGLGPRTVAAADDEPSQAAADYSL